MRARILLLLVVSLLIAACGEPESKAPPAPAELTREAVGYYCSMIVKDHSGPKGQIFLRGRSEPVWFSSVRDTVAFTLLPDEPSDIAAIYVNDMGRAQWDHPEADTWIDATKAWYVIESSRRGGMGAPEAVPFLDKFQAEQFVTDKGGRIVTLDEIPDDYILGTGAAEHNTTAEHGGATAGSH